MQAMVINEFGGPNIFQAVQVPRPEVRAGHVLIRVAASSVNPHDYNVRKGAAPPAIAPAFPAILHGDVAGTIEEVGEGVTAFHRGDEVYACAGGVKGTSGALADYMLADADLVAPKPKSLSMTQAAALPLVALTAWEGLIDRAQMYAGQTVLVHGATGGVGHLAIQLAKARGARVFATASTTEKARIAQALGADVAIEYHTQSVAEYVAEYTGGKGFDIVFDSVGGANFAQSVEATAPRGTIISIVPNATLDLSLLLFKGLSLHTVFTYVPLLYGMGRAAHGRILTELAKLVDEGKVCPLIDEHTFALREVAAAHQFLESGRALGKVVLVNS
ncbi:zinc-dependent alcohol dehydrogenase family protein [Reticulibacter mediterranei]